MAEDELEELRRRRLAQLQREQESGIPDEESYAQHQAQEAEHEAQKQAILRQLLTPEARDRLARVRLARPKVAENLESQIIMLAQQGRVRGQIDDRTLRELLARVQPKPRDINIERR